MWWMLLASALAGPVEVQDVPALHAHDPLTSRRAIEGLVALTTQRVFALELGGAGTVPAFVPYPGVTEPLAYGLVVHNPLDGGLDCVGPYRGD